MAQTIVFPSSALDVPVAQTIVSVVCVDVPAGQTTHNDGLPHYDGAFLRIAALMVSRTRANE